MEDDAEDAEPEDLMPDSGKARNLAGRLQVRGRLNDPRALEYGAVALGICVVGPWVEVQQRDELPEVVRGVSKSN